MVKARMTTVDVASEAKCLRRHIGMRCANVYDLSPKTYMFKLMNSSGITESGEGEKVLLLVESGVRFHTTQYVRDKNTTPSGFTLKLRKHIRSKRLEDVRQLGYDRIILLQFGLGSNANYIILELYAQGNILLTDSEFTVMTLLRSHRDDNKGLAIMSRHRYPVEACRIFERTNFEKLKDSLLMIDSSDVKEPAESTEDVPSIVDEPKEAVNTKKGKKRGPNKVADGTKPNTVTLKTILGNFLTYGPSVAEHILLDAGLVPSQRVGSEPDSKISDDHIELLVQAVTKFEDWLADVILGENVPNGYILIKSAGGKNSMASTEGSDKPKVYDEYCPLLLHQFKSREYSEFETFDAALDEFYSKIESQRIQQHQKSKEESAAQKLNKIRMDQENRVLTLKKEVDYCIKMAELIEYNLEDVDAALVAVRAALANEMNWNDLARMIKEERKLGNPVAGLIDELHLERNCITLLLSNNLDEMDEEEKTAPAEKVEVDLALSAHANARRWYDMKKKQESKQEKTVTAHEKAFKAAEKKTRLQLAQEKKVAVITHMRKVHWFEKFNWFISSENYLVISGRDAQQNEMLVKRYMSKGDLYVHADLHGASSTVIKNHRSDYPVPPLTLNQAGCFTVCHSQAWDSKIVTSAWWVYPHQVSKTAPTGEYLTVGSFMIRGKKNFLPPHPLVMGFGILFRLEDSSLESHANERRVRGEDDGLAENEVDSREGQSWNSESDDEIPSEEEKGSETPQDPTPDEPKTEPVPANSFDEVVSGRPEISENGSSSNLGATNGPSLSDKLEDLIDKALVLGPSSTARNIAFHVPQNEEDFGQEVKQVAARDKPYMSKAERRKLKKGQNNNEGREDAHTNEAEQGLETSQTSSDSQSNQQDKGKNANPKVSRGQKGKLKKIKEKYADQDEEEREVRMALLASSGKAARKEKPLNEPVQVDSVQQNSISGQNVSSKVCYKCKKAGHLARDCKEYEPVIDREQSNSSVSDDVTLEGNGVASALGYIPIEDDNIQENDDVERGKANELDCLTGIPIQSDVLLYSVPVCGPYNAVQNYKYRVKITPGAAKKGKAVKSAMNLFLNMPDVTSREKELLKACTEPELVAAILGNCKITAPGLAQLKQKQKKGKAKAKVSSNDDLVVDAGQLP